MRCQGLHVSAAAIQGPLWRHENRLHATHTHTRALCDLVIAANFPSRFPSPAETSEGAARGAAIPIVAPPVRRRCNRGGY